jgi:restriction system protein
MDHPEGLRASVAIERLANAVTLTDYEAGNYETTGERRFDKIVRFSTITCVKAGWLLKHKGTWTVTEEGIKAFKSLPDPEQFYRESVKLYYSWRATQRRDAKAEEPTIEEVDSPAPEETASITFEQAEEQAWNEIEQHLRAINPFDLQKLVADLLRAMGYYVSWVSPPGRDAGVDIIAHADPLGAKPPRIKVQVKRHGQRMDLDGLKSFLATVSDHDIGLFVSTGGFTKDAADFARSQERRQVTLIDLERLVDLWIEHYGRLDELAKRRLPLTPIYFLTPES